MKRGNKTTGKKKILFIILLIVIIILAVIVVLKFTGYSVRVFPSKTAACSDSDSSVSIVRYRNGINYYVKGICRDKTLILEDKCFDKNTVQEAHCSSDKLRCLDTLFYCAYGCENGVCRSKNA